MGVFTAATACQCLQVDPIGYEVLRILLPNMHIFLHPAVHTYA